MVRLHGKKDSSAYTTKSNTDHLLHKRLKYMMEKNLTKVNIIDKKKSQRI